MSILNPPLDSPADDLAHRLSNPDVDEIAALDAWWRANLYLTVAQIYLQANPLLREPLRPEHIKPRCWGIGGQSPGSASSTPMTNRLIRESGRRPSSLPGPATVDRRWWPMWT